MSENKTILDQARDAGLARPSGGMRVPDGYFDSFAERMSSLLPDRPELNEESTADRPRTLWTAVRPYVYMAAMFAGVWCMMQMFHLMSGNTDLAPMDSNPVLAHGLSTDEFLYDYIMSDITSRDVFNDMVDNGMITEHFDMTSLSEEQANPNETNQI